MENIKMEFKHPKYYTELRRAGVQVNSSRPAHSRCNKSDQVISKESSTEENQRAPGPGLKQRDSTGGVPGEADISVTSLKLQATSAKLQAPSSDKKL
jgi:hypothetical protein